VNTLQGRVSDDRDTRFWRQDEASLLGDILCALDRTVSGCSDECSGWPEEGPKRRSLASSGKCRLKAPWLPLSRQIPSLIRRNLARCDALRRVTAGTPSLPEIHPHAERRNDEDPATLLQSPKNPREAGVVNRSVVSLRPASPDDAEFVNTLTRTVMLDYVSKTWSSTEERDAYFEKNKLDLATTRIIQLDGKDVGRISVIRSSTDVLIDNIHVLPQYQSKGIGSKVIQETLDEASEEGLPVSLQLLRSNPVKSLYERLGFKIISENKTHIFMISVLHKK
jgi:ribosomal protein S18 acetylase RimI-like enzyme